VVPLPHHDAAWQLAILEPAGAARSGDRSAIVLHDRLGSHGETIDHIAISPTGVYVIDAHDDAGKVRVEKPWLGPPRLKVGGLDRSVLVDDLDAHVAAVRAALPALSELRSPTPVTGVLFFTGAELPHLGTLAVRRHLILHRKALAKRIDARGPLGAGAIRELAHHLEVVLGHL
jgi:hypothetical protein